MRPWVRSAAVAIVSAAVAGGAVWQVRGPRGATGEGAPVKPAAEPAIAAPVAASADRGAGVTDLGSQLTSVETAAAEPVDDWLGINGRLALNALRVYRPSARVAGRLERIDVFEGAAVRAGQPIAQLFSPEYISAQREYLLARNAVRTVGASATTDLADDARATLAAARSRLSVLGVDAAEIDRLDRTGVVLERMLIRSPASGRFVRRDVDPGAYLNVGDAFGSVADMSSLWFIGSVYPVDLPRIHLGDAAEITVDGVAAGQPFRGTVTFIAPTLDPQTHALPVRVELANPHDLLKAEMFARARILLGRQVLPVVPRRAVIEYGADAYVVVRRPDGRFERVLVEFRDLGLPDRVAITRGVQPGDPVVVDGSILMERKLAPRDRRGAPEAPARP